LRQDSLNIALHCGEFNIWLPSFGFVPVAEQFSIGPHSHYYYEIHYIDDGRGVNIIHHDRAEIALEQGTFYLAKPGEVHEQHSMRAHPLSIFFIGFNISPAGDDHTTANELNIRLERVARLQRQAYFLKPLVQSVLVETQRKSYGYEWALKGLMLQLITAIARTAPDSAGHTASFEKESMLRRSIDYVRENLHRRIEVEELAALHNMSVSHFRRLFKETSGMAVGEFMRTCRLEKAQFLLQAHVPVKEVAFRLGYESPEQFSKIFKHAVGCSPVRLRNGLQLQETDNG